MDIYSNITNRRISVYLPPGYDQSNKRYPVIYYLHGFMNNDSILPNGKNILDMAIAKNKIRPYILVIADNNTLFSGSFYSNSSLTGYWSDFEAKELVAYMDKNFRTIATRDARGIGGHSMGGYGTIRIGMKRPDVFASVYALSACCLTANISPRVEGLAAAEAIKTREDVAKAERGPLGTFARAAAWSPNPDNPPLYLDLPVKDGKVRPDIVAKWVANSPLEMLEEHAANLRKYYAIAIEIGTSDGLLASNKQLHETMTGLQIPHHYEEYDGDHTNRVRERIERNVLPFFSKNLAAPANPTSPSPQSNH